MLSITTTLLQNPKEVQNSHILTAVHAYLAIRHPMTVNLWTFLKRRVQLLQTRSEIYPQLK